MEQITLQWQNFWNFVGQTDVGNEEKGLRFKKIVLFWQNIWNNRKIAAEINEKLPDHEEALCWGIKLIYLCLSKKWKPCHGYFNGRPRNLRSPLEKYFRFHWNCKLLRKSMSHCEIYSELLSETRRTILKIFSQHDLRKWR